MNIKKGPILFSMLSHNIPDYNNEYEDSEDEFAIFSACKNLNLKSSFSKEDHSASCGELATIQELEEDEFQFSYLVEKQSRSGIMFNKRVISIDQEYFSYYPLTQLNNHNRIVDLDNKAKARIQIQYIQDIIIPIDKPNFMRISGKGVVCKKDKSQKNAQEQQFSYLFRFQDAKMPLIWKNLIIATKKAVKSKQYLMTFENLISIPRSFSE